MKGSKGQCGQGGSFLEGGQQQIVPLPAPAPRSLSFWLMTWLFDLPASTTASFPTPTLWPFWSRGKQRAKSILFSMENSSDEPNPPKGCWGLGAGEGPESRVSPAPAPGSPPPLPQGHLPRKPCLGGRSFPVPRAGRRGRRSQGAPWGCGKGGCAHRSLP